MIIANRKIQMNNLEQTCSSCPTIYEFDDKEGNHYYFRYRWGCWKLVNEKTNSILVSGEGYRNNDVDYLDGTCSKEEMIQWVLDEGIYLYEGELEPSFEEKVIEELAKEIKREVVFYDSDGISHCDISEEEFEKCTKHDNGNNCVNCIINWAKEKVIKNEK